MTGGNMSRREKIIIFAVAAVCLVCSVIFVFIPKKSGSYAVISLDGETVMKKVSATRAHSPSLRYRIWSLR